MGKDQATAKSQKEVLQIITYDPDHQSRKLLEESLDSSQIYGKEVCINAFATHEEALHHIVESNPDLVLMSLSEPDQTSLGLCRYIRAHIHGKGYTGIIFLTEETQSSTHIQALKQGADDVCSKHMQIEELKARIYAVARTKTLIDSLQASTKRLRSQNQKLSKITITDELTKLNNMSYFWKRLRQEFARAERYEKELSIIMIDLDKFKKVNDGHDHLLGSFVIAKVGEIIAENVRFLDIAARYGGDEYVILLPETSLKGAISTADRIRSEISEHVFDNGFHQVKISSSIGVANMHPETSEMSYKNHEDILRAADRYLYEAKERGRNMVVSHLNTTHYQTKKPETENSRIKDTAGRKNPK